MNVHTPGDTGHGPADHPDIAWRRLDSRVVWVDAVQALLSLTPGVFAVFVLDVAVDGFLLWSVVAVAGFGVYASGADLWRWIKTRYRVTPDRVELRTGWFVRSRRFVQRERIRSVDSNAKLRHRLAGLRVVEIGAGQQAAAGEAAFALDAVSRAEAAQLRRALLGSTPQTTPESDAQVSSADDGAGDDTSNREQLISGLRARWVVHNVVNVWAFLAAAGALWGVYWLAMTFGVDVHGLVSGVVDWNSLGLVWSTLLAVLAVGAVGVTVLAFSFFTEYWNFRLTRVPGSGHSSLRTTQGLFTTREVNRDERRIRGVAISEPLLWRWMRTADTNVISTGLKQGMYDASTVVPRGPVGEARRVAREVLPDSDAVMEAPLVPAPRAALHRRLWWAVLGSAVAATITAYLQTTVDFLPGWAWLVAAATLPLTLAGAVVAYRALGHALHGEYFVARCGLNARYTAALQTRAVIGWSFRQSPLQRRLGLLSIEASTAAGHGGYGLPDVAYDQALRAAYTADPQLLGPFLAPDPPAPTDADYEPQDILRA